MKKILITALSIFLIGGAIRAQNVASGINDWYAERYQGAKATFEKLQAANPNDIQAAYWLGQTYIAMNDLAGAKNVYTKALATSANAPLLEVGMGQVELNENKINEARQRFEKAITMSTGKKGGDPEILNAVGRAIADTYTDKEKKGDINFAVQKLEEAANAKPKDNALLADIYLNLGDAYRLARPGENGGLAFSNYQKAIDANPNFPVPSYRMAKLFNTQHNWDLYEKYLTDAITKDPRFAPAYYDLSYYKMGKLLLPESEEFATKFAQNADPDPQNEYLKASLMWAQKKYDDAIALSKSIISRIGEDKTRARVYKLIANAYVSKGDTLPGKDYIDKYFAKLRPDDEVVPKDYKLKADIYSAIPGQEAVVLASYQEGIKVDTVIDNKIELLKLGIEFFAKKKQYDKEAALWQTLLETKPNPTINDLFGATLANYRAKTPEGYSKAYALSNTMVEKYPDQIFGYEWRFNSAVVIDTVKKDSIMVPAAMSLLEFAQKDTSKYLKQVYNSSYRIALYHADKDAKDKAIDYLRIMKQSTRDTAQQASIQKNIDVLSKPASSGTRPAAPRSSSTAPAKKAEAGS